MSKERPILFSAPMVRAILEGRKTQTRRIVKPQPPEGHHIDTCHYNDTGWAFWVSHPGNAGSCTCKNLRQPYGVPGDHLWVRETWGMFEETHKCIPHYRATHATDVVPRWRPSIHMPRWASRITLEVVSVRVERLQECSMVDALAEGVSGRDPDTGAWENPKEQYADLWESINGPGSWNANPWVWVITFKDLNPW